ncbi:MAG: hypothetical protein ACYTFK_13040 [Planctomycetota bacterium]|jgi:hypothetical protein
MKVLWKEWQQQKWLFLLFCVLGIALPLFQVIIIWLLRGNFQSEVGSGVVLCFGALFAVLLSIATTNSDVKKGVDNFLLSKPVRVRRLFVAKIALAAVLLWVAFLFISVFDLASEVTHKLSLASFAWAAICYTYPISLMLFAVTMFLVVVLRDTAKAVLLAIWAALMVYFLPLLTGSLEWMNIFGQLDNIYVRQSVVQYLIHLCSSLIRTGLGTTIHTPGGIPDTVYQDPVYQMTWFQGLLHIVGSPAYLQYLLFVAVTTVVSVICVILSVKAMKNRWRWQPGQKTIVWTIGLSAAFIFSMAMTQVGHNIEPITEHDGKQLVSPARFDWNYMPMELHGDLPEGGEWIGPNNQFFNSREEAVCFKDDLMFRMNCGFQGKEGQPPLGWEEEVIQHFVLQIYRFPYEENNEADKGSWAPDFVVGAIKFFSTESVERGITQSIYGCYIRNDRLYAAYQPMYKKNEDGGYSGRVNPIRFITIDIRNPAKPKIVADMEISNSIHFGGDMTTYNDHCYVITGSELLIISVDEPDKPEIIKRITSDDLVKNGIFGTDVENYLWIPNRWLLAVENKLLCANDRRVVILDLSEPLKPQIIYEEIFTSNQTLYYDRIEAITYKENFLYILTKKGIYVRKLMPTEDGSYVSELIGQRRATPIEKLARRRPGELLFHDGYLVESAWSFGVLVYDVSNPARPKRAFHAQNLPYVSDIGIWDGLLYMQGSDYGLAFLDIPKTD